MLKRVNELSVFPDKQCDLANGFEDMRYTQSRRGRGSRYQADLQSTAQAKDVVVKLRQSSEDKGVPAAGIVLTEHRCIFPPRNVVGVVSPGRLLPLVVKVDAPDRKSVV